jgi:hypothetical protein
MAYTRRLPVTVLVATLLTLSLFIELPHAFAQNSIIELLKERPEWLGIETYYRGRGSPKPEAVNVKHAFTFQVTGDPPTLKEISWWREGEKQGIVEFSVGTTSLEFLIPPRELDRWFKFTLTKDGGLKGFVTGISPRGTNRFSNDVLLKPKQ